jgi:hypothetical protein
MALPPVATILTTSGLCISRRFEARGSAALTVAAVSTVATISTISTIVLTEHGRAREKHGERRDETVAEQGSEIHGGFSISAQTLTIEDLVSS